MGSPPRLTIAIPFYSNVKYLRLAVESVLAQSSQDWLLVISDDCGPNPEAKECIDRYNDPRISYSRAEKNLGLAGNWNRCMDLATTDWVAVFHADDELENGYVENMLKATNNSSAPTAIYCQSRVIDSSSRLVFSFPDYVKSWISPRRDQPVLLSGDSALAQILKGNFIFCPTLCYRKSALQGLRFDSRWRMVLDLNFIKEIFVNGGKILGLPYVGYRYRRHSNNQTSLLTAELTRFEEEIKIYNDIADQCERISWHQSVKVARAKTMIKLHIGYRMVGDLLRGKLPQVRKKIKILASL